jgi:putative ABC transport system substrate-binding protein
MRRRGFLAFMGGAAAVLPALARAQRAPQASRVPLIGILSPAGPETGWFSEGLRQGLRDQGYVDGQSIRLEYRWAYGQFDRLPRLAAELVELRVDLIVAGVTQGSLAAKAATRTIPIVMVAVGDPLGSGLIDSLARPGGNITGTAVMATDVVGKQLALLKELDPALQHVAVLWNPANAVFQARQVEEVEVASRRLGLRLDFFAASAPDTLADAFAAMRRDGARALHVLIDPVFVLHRRELAALIAATRLAAVSGVRDFAEEGGVLMTYGADFVDSTRRSMAYVAKILRGAKPGDLAVEQPIKFELVVNLKTAKQLGITIPEPILTRADEVIE